MYLFNYLWLFTLLCLPAKVTGFSQIGIAGAQQQTNRSVIICIQARKHSHQVGKEKQNHCRGSLNEKIENWLWTPQRGSGLCVKQRRVQSEDIPLQTLQHLPSGKICSLRVQLSSGQVSVTFTIRPFWKGRMKSENDAASRYSINIAVTNGYGMCCKALMVKISVLTGSELRTLAGQHHTSCKLL